MKLQFTAQWSLAHDSSLDFCFGKDLFVLDQWVFFFLFTTLLAPESIRAATSAS